MSHHYHALVTRYTCGRCGVRRDLHPVEHANCRRATLSWWWQRHSLHHHLGAWGWIHLLTRNGRWRIARQLHDRLGLHWCDLVDSVTYADQWDDEHNGLYLSRGRRHDYAGAYACLCDFPAPWQAARRAPAEGCYCTPAQTELPA